MVSDHNRVNTDGRSDDGAKQRNDFIPGGDVSLSASLRLHEVFELSAHRVFLTAWASTRTIRSAAVSWPCFVSIRIRRGRFSFIARVLPQSRLSRSPPAGEEDFAVCAAAGGDWAGRWGVSICTEGGRGLVMSAMMLVVTVKQEEREALHPIIG